LTADMTYAENFLPAGRLADRMYFTVSTSSANTAFELKSLLMKFALVRAK